MEQTPRDTRDWLANDEIPESLIPILRWQFRDQIPYVRNVISMTSEWLAGHPDTSELPRFIGKARFNIGEASGRRMCAPYAQWMYQRVTEPLKHATESDHTALAQWLARHRLQHDLSPPDNLIYFYDSRVWRRKK